MNVNIKVGLVCFTLSYTLLAGQRLSFPCNNLSWHIIWIRICAPCLKTIAENKQIETLNLDGNLRTRNRHFIQKFWTEISENKQISMLRFLRIRAKICSYKYSSNRWVISKCFVGTLVLLIGYWRDKYTHQPTTE